VRPVAFGRVRDVAEPHAREQDVVHVVLLVAHAHRGLHVRAVCMRLQHGRDAVPRRPSAMLRHHMPSHHAEHVLVPRVEDAGRENGRVGVVEAHWPVDKITTLRTLVHAEARPREAVVRVVPQVEHQVHAVRLGALLQAHEPRVAAAPHGARRIVLRARKERARVPLVVDDHGVPREVSARAPCSSSRNASIRPDDATRSAPSWACCPPHTRRSAAHVRHRTRTRPGRTAAPSPPRSASRRASNHGVSAMPTRRTPSTGPRGPPARPSSRRSRPTGRPCPPGAR